jgi:hypothetical protein
MSRCFRSASAKIVVSMKALLGKDIAQNFSFGRIGHKSRLCQGINEVQCRREWHEWIVVEEQKELPPKRH